MRRYTLLTSLFVLFTVFVMLWQQPAYAQVEDWETTDPATSCVVDGVPTLECLEVVYGNMLYLSSALVLLILFFMIVYGAFVFLTSMGDATKIGSGKKILTWAFIGLGVYLASYVILLVIDVAFMGGKGEIFRLNIPGPRD